MHQTSMNNMAGMIARHLDRSAPLTILDVGAYSVNGTYRPLFAAPGWSYTGTDIQGDASRNVDVLMPSAYELPFPDESMDLVVSGQAFEHIEWPWLTMKEIARVTRPRGMIFIIAPSQGHEHRYPVDCWRFYPDGFRALAKWAGLDVLEVYRDKNGMWRDMCGAFRKPEAER